MGARRILITGGAGPVERDVGVNDGTAMSRCVSDPRDLSDLARREPRTGVREGVGRLHAWLREQPFMRRAGVAAEATT